MNIDANTWAVEEFGGADLGDVRRTQRLIRIAQDRAARPSASLAESCPESAARKAAYRFFENDRIQRDSIVTSHQQATLDRLVRYRAAVVLAVQDTTELDYTDHPATTGLGRLSTSRQQGLFLHTTLAVTPHRVPLGLLDQQVWVRTPDVGKCRQRRDRPIADKESQKWLTSLQAVAAAQAHLPDTRLVSVGDREADIYDLFLAATTPPQDLLVRAAWDRRVDHPEKYLWDYLANQAVAGELVITVPRRPGKTSRLATLQVRYAAVTLRPPQHRSGEHLPLVELWAVWAHEDQPPADEEAVSWLLLTTVAVNDFDAACERVQWYTCRWVIEMYHRVLKSGCRIEERQFDSVENIERYLAVDSIVAWRVLYLTLLGRESPELPCSVIFETAEWQALYCFVSRTRNPPAEPPPLRQVIRWVGQLGGFMARKSDGEPGTQVIWIGLQRLSDITAAWQVFGNPTPSPPIVGKD